MKRSLVLNIFTLILPVITAIAATSPLDGHRIRHYTVSDGLSSNAVYSIHQDSKGRMWFGTIDGLHSFDGHVMKEWRDEHMKTLGSVIHCIAQDESHRLWIGSNRGITLFDLQQEHFAELPVDPSSGIRIKSPVSRISFGADGKVWLSTIGEGVFSYDQATRRLSQYPAPARIPDDYVNSVLEDSAGNVWCASRTGVSRYNPGQDRFVYVPADDSSGIYATSVFEDSRHNIWVGTINDGLYMYDETSGQLIPTLKSLETNILPPPIRKIKEWGDGRLALATDTGLLFYDTGSGVHSLVQAREDTENALDDNYLHSLYVDREGALWIGSYFGGVCHVTPHKFSFIHYNSHNTNLNAKVISVFAEGDDGNMWIGSDDNGVFHWNRHTGVFSSVDSHPLMKGAPHKNIHAMLKDGDKLMIGMYMGGLNILDLITGNVINHTKGNTPGSLYSSSIYSLYKDIEGVIYVGTSEGLNIYHPDTDSFERVFDVHPADVCFITDDHRGYLWACTTDAGLYRMNRDTGKWEHFYERDTASGAGRQGSLPTNSIVTAECDQDGNMWFGTDGNGLLAFDYDTHTFSCRSLPKEIRVINKIISSGDDLWISSSKGLYCYNPVTNEIRGFDRNSGLKENIFLPNSGLKRPDGSILIGSINGISEFHPDSITRRRYDPEVILTDFHIFNKPVEIGVQGSGLKESITYASELVLPYDRNMISFRVSPINFANPTQNSYLYILDGFDKDWYEANPSYTHSYANIPPGSYTFRVRTSDGNGGWNTEAVSLPVRILPPWWRSTFMIILYFVVSALAVCGIYRYFLNRQREKLRKLADEKDRDLYRSRIEMFTGIVHEIRTPLTLILSPLENIMHSDISMQECRRHLSIMERNGQRLLNMVNHLLDFRKLESGGMKLEPEPVDLRVPLRHMCDDIILSATVKNISVSVDMPRDPCVSVIDRKAFRHVVYNLLSNALKFTKTRIEVAIRKDPDGRIRLSVKDDGDGIPPEERDKIFMPFYQIAGNRQTDNIGTGLGLLLVKSLSTLMDAEVSLDSTVGEGSEFTVSFIASDSLPVDINGEEATQAFEQKDGDDYVETDVTTPIDTDDTTPPSDVKRQVVIVDDNDDMLGFLCSLLSATYDVKAFSRADEALEPIRTSPPDLVISDVMMPGTDGMEFCRILKNDIRTSHVPVILLTAKVENTDVIDGFDNGADMYIIKPFSPKVIEARIRSILKNRDILRDRFRETPSVIDTMMPDDSPDKRFFLKIRSIIEEHIADPNLSIDSMAREAGVSRTGLFTKLKAVAQITPNEYIRKIRLEKAAELLRKNNVRVSEVCYIVGFQSRSHFTRSFVAQYGISPREYQSQPDK